jgi:hypothetical protein
MTPEWKAAAAQYHAERLARERPKSGGSFTPLRKAANGHDPRADVPPASSPEDFRYNAKAKANGEAPVFDSGRAHRAFR